MERQWPVRGGERGRPVSERFWEKVDRSGECWIWMGARTSRGYGVIQVNGRGEYVHRFLFTIEGRPLQPGQWACHHCDTPLCVRPAHLYAGDGFTNNRDTIDHGRRNPNSDHRTI